MYRSRIQARHNRLPLQCSQDGREGFTLIEMSIVLVIIGLIIGGILVGQDLIRTAKLKSLYQEIEQIRTATTAFRLKYNALPGDVSNAILLFPSVITQNGNGSNIIEGFGWTAGGYTFESYCFWEHLNESGLFTSVSDCPWTSYGGAAGPPVLNVTMPASKAFPNAGFSITSQFSAGVGIALVKNGEYNGSLVLSPKDAAWLDDKYDNGKPNSGTIYLQTYNAACNFGNVYQRANDNIDCKGLEFRLFKAGY